MRDAEGQESTVVLRQGDTFVVPKGTEHKPSSPGGSILMFEPPRNLVAPEIVTRARSPTTWTARRAIALG